MSIDLNDALFAKLAGWEAMQRARALVASGSVLQSEWHSPQLRGRVREGSATYPAGLLIRSALDADNVCPCRDSRDRGLICAHSIAVGLHYLRSLASADLPPSPPNFKPSSAAPIQRRSTKSLTRVDPGVAGESLEVFVILPPNLREALPRGHVMLCLEGRWRNRHCPLSSLPFQTPFALDPQDAKLLTALEGLNNGDTPSMVRLNHEQFASLLPHLVGHPRVTLGKGRTVRIIDDPLRPVLRARLEPGGEILLSLAGAAPQGIIHGSPSWVFTDLTLRPLDLPTGFENLVKAAMRIPRPRVPRFLIRQWPQLVNQHQAEAGFNSEDFTFVTLKPQFTLHLAGHLAALEARIDGSYGDRPFAGFANDEPWFVDPQSPTRYFARDLEAERAALARLFQAGFTGPVPGGLYHLKGQNAVLNFFARYYPRLEQEWHVTLEERLERNTRKNLDWLEPRFQISASGEQWFDLNIAYETRGGERLAPAEVQRLLRSGQSHAPHKNGKSVLLDTGAVEELQEVLLDCAPQQHPGGYRLDNAQAGFLDATLRQHSQWQVQAPKAWQQRAARQRGEIKITPPPLGDLESVLRPYQKYGVAWFRFLRANGFGGILADEMGLGKTLQALVHIALLRIRIPSHADVPPADHPTLVVCPTSLVFNWAQEAAKYSLGLRVLTLQGPRRRESLALIPNHDLVITSYALLRRDAECYRDLTFDTVILDEAQHIKNRQTQNAQAVKAIRSQHRLVLTGTPIENSVLDLWSIYDFLMPGYLGAAPDFRERYELPIVRDRDRQVQERLARRLQPFLLRRLKREVAADLPPKIEQVSTCDLTDTQKQVYQQVLHATRQELSGAASNRALPQGRMIVLTALLRLRQICCDLRLLPVAAPPHPVDPAPIQPSILPDAESWQAGQSAKLELFEELLDEVLDGGHRVLVFSQFTRMLALLREKLSARDLPFCYLDGSTPNRTAIVDRFQRDPAIPVFLISLKAGGQGLNLTGADTVIHFDPWWNPAVEAQATDRAHRIGQQNVVTSYKLIARGTVEEKILNLQTRKRGLFDVMLGDEEQLAASLSWEEIQDLLKD